MRTALVLILSLASTGAVADSNVSDESALVTQLRTALEQQFRTSTGLGFASFDCDLSPRTPLGQEVTCDAVDEEGDRFLYRIFSGAQDGPPTVSTSQPVSQLATEGRQVIEAPCLAFLDAFGRGVWEDAYAELSVEFSNGFSLDELKSLLRPLRDALGDLTGAKALTYATPSPGLHQLEYALDTSQGEAVARFRLRIGDGQQAHIDSFLITARPGSQLQATLLSAVGREALTPLLGQPVVRLTGPLATLERIGDTIEGQAVLEDQTAVPIWVEQHNTAHDLDPNDYRFRVLDVPFLIHRYLVSTGVESETISCPSRTAPDGGRIDCVAVLPGGTERAISVARRGGDHRLLRPEQ